MRVWLYYRLSRDEDKQFNSLKNQYSIIESYALNNGHTIVGSSFDDNVSGMHFNRAGIDELTEAVENGMIDAVIVKDLSRLGRHKTSTRRSSPKRNGGRHRNYSSKMPDPLTATGRRTGIPVCSPAVTAAILLYP